MGMQYGSVESTVSWGLNLTETTVAQALQMSSPYSTYFLGKWNVGHYMPALLPTSRGFDYFLGYQSGSSMYWSKTSPNTKSRTSSNSHDAVEFVDLLYGDGSCYAAYDGSDKHDYSTFLYRDKAVNIIKHHKYKAPLFLLVAFQAVHDPFVDVGTFSSGIPKTYVGTSMYRKIKANVVGRRRRQYAMALYLMDEAIDRIQAAVKKVNQMDNTYFIFTSDNGGCASAGGRNGPLRGNKGTLFEGGTKVDALLYSSSLATSMQGTSYAGLMHVVDWFPTILDMAGVSYTPPAGYELDGVSHWAKLQTLDNSNSDAVVISPRTYMLYNYYADVDEVDFPTDGVVRAARNSQYKYITTWVDDAYSSWDEPDVAQSDDSNLETWGTCEQANGWKIGTYSEFLFDLASDPYEVTNLWDDETYAETKNELEQVLDTYYANRKTDVIRFRESKACFEAFREAGNYIVPWAVGSTGYPTFNKDGCEATLVSPDSTADVDDDNFSDLSPTQQPTFEPSFEPTRRPSVSP